MVGEVLQLVAFLVGGRSCETGWTNRYDDYQGDGQIADDIREHDDAELAGFSQS